jgi:hypothetical protein
MIETILIDEHIYQINILSFTKDFLNSWYEQYESFFLLYHSYLTNETFSPRTKCSPGVYYIKGIEKWKKSGSLGLMNSFYL